MLPKLLSGDNGGRFEVVENKCEERELAYKIRTRKLQYDTKEAWEARVPWWLSPKASKDITFFVQAVWKSEGLPLKGCHFRD